MCSRTKPDCSLACKTYSNWATSRCTLNSREVHRRKRSRIVSQGTLKPPARSQAPNSHRLHAPEAEADLEPIEPLSGIAYATARTITGIIGGVADYPIEITKAIRSRDKPTSRSSSPHPASPNPLLASHQPPTQAREPTSPLSQAADFTKHKGVARIIGTGLRAPMDFTYNLARGFHNAPKLYGDETVRESPKITDIKSGLKASGSVSSWNRDFPSCTLLTVFGRNLGTVSTTVSQASSRSR